jgi:hypothetical protein
MKERINKKKKKILESSKNIHTIIRTQEIKMILGMEAIRKVTLMSTLIGNKIITIFTIQDPQGKRKTVYGMM